MWRQSAHTEMSNNKAVLKFEKDYKLLRAQNYYCCPRKLEETSQMQTLCKACKMSVRLLIVYNYVYNQAFIFPWMHLMFILVKCFKPLWTWSYVVLFLHVHSDLQVNTDNLDQSEAHKIKALSSTASHPASF